MFRHQERSNFRNQKKEAGNPCAGGLGWTVARWWLRLAGGRYLADHPDNQGKVHSAATEGAKVSPGSHWEIYSDFLKD